MANEALKLMEDNLNLVWNEKEPARRAAAIEKIYAADAGLYHTDHRVTGQDAINNTVTATQEKLPAGFVFSILRPVIINHDTGRLIWGAGPEGQAPVITGMDIARFDNGRISALYVFLD